MVEQRVISEPPGQGGERPVCIDIDINIRQRFHVDSVGALGFSLTKSTQAVVRPKSFGAVSPIEGARISRCR